LGDSNRLRLLLIAVFLVILGGFAPDCGAAAISAVWANDGHDKVTKDELRLSEGADVCNAVWDGNTVRIFGAKNEVVSFNLVIEAAGGKAKDISVELDRLEGPGGATITSREASGEGVFDYTGRNIELFYVRYLQIIGVSRLAYMPDYDERHVPERFRLPYTMPKGRSSGTFEQRPDAYKYYPDIAVPLELEGDFTIPAKSNQSIWVDVYIPDDFPKGRYKGEVAIRQGADALKRVPVVLEVLPFALPDRFHAKTMVWLNEPDINHRYTGVRWSDSGAATPDKRKVMQTVWYRHQQMAKRHRVSLISDGVEFFRKVGMTHWKHVFSGDLFSAERGYDGPGQVMPGDVYSAGTYGSWRSLKSWDEKSREDMWKNTDRIESYFQEEYPEVARFLYLLDEPSSKSFDRVEKWARWVDENPGPGKNLDTLCTTSLVNIRNHMPSVDIGFEIWGEEDAGREASRVTRKLGKPVMTYNGWRPSAGTFMIEDDGVALRVNGWIQFKHDIDRWFYWASTNYRNPSFVNSETNVFEKAATFGRIRERVHRKYGETGNGYGNGDGVLFYPGTDTVYPEESYGVHGPIASLRLKLWRRGLQDYEYLRLAGYKNPAAVDELVAEMVPVSLWELGVTDKNDPTYVHADISWSTDPDNWEAARRKLADIILTQ